MGCPSMKTALCPFRSLSSAYRLTSTNGLIDEWNESYRTKYESWEHSRAEFIEAQNQYNNDLLMMSKSHEVREKSTVEEYCSLVLSRSEYPFAFSKDYQLEYLPDSQVLALDYGLPTIDVIPALKDAKFVKSRGK
jgi:restriction system protein